jgi:hypothetical protein
MIESTVINKMLADDTLCDMLATYGGDPAIFSDAAPENCERPLLIVSVGESIADGAHEVMEFSISIDFFDTGSSRTVSRNAAERIIFALDDQKLEHERYGDIRINYFSGGPVPDDDPREIHHNLQFTARGTRMKWMNETKS